ncbi:MAG: lysophospholipid acyltransferase family protein [Planctomycetota bacterium]
MLSLDYLLVRSVLLGLQCIPYRAALRLARTAARVAFRFDARPRARAIANLGLIYGESMDAMQREHVARGVYEMIARQIVEVAHLTRQQDRGLIIENAAIVQAAYAQGRGVVAVSAHMGPFVRMAMVPKVMGLRVAAVMKRQQNDVLLEWGREYVRREFDIHTFLKADARDTIEDLLRDGWLVGLFADQYPRKGGFPCTFFGRPVMAPAGPAVYARRCGSPLLVATTVSRGDQIVLRWEGPVSSAGTYEEISQRWMSLLEARIREHPQEWTWMHRRWRDAAAPDIRVVAEQAIARR